MRDLFNKEISIFFLIFLSFIALHLFVNIIKSKDSICDSEKQSKFILECLKVNKTKCEQMSIRLYCK